MVTSREGWEGGIDWEFGIDTYTLVYLFIYLFRLLCCCARAFSSCGEWGLLFIAVRGLLIEVAFLVAEHGLQAHRLH